MYKQLLIPIIILFTVISCSEQKSNNDVNEDEINATEVQPPAFSYIDLSSIPESDPKQNWITIHNRDDIPLTGGGVYVFQFSLRNNSNRDLKGIEVRLISKDASGQVIDFRDYTFFKDKGIPSGLARTVPYKRPPDYYIEETEGGTTEFEILGFDQKN